MMHRVEPHRLKAHDVAQRLGVNVETVWRWLRNGQLLALNVGGRGKPSYRISESALAEFLESRKKRRVRA